MNKAKALHAIKDLSSEMYYTHGYPGTWDNFPKLQLYQSKGAATRQLNKLKNRNDSLVLVIVEIEIKEI